jgi:hypothetical protein
MRIFIFIFLIAGTFSKVFAVADWTRVDVSGSVAVSFPGEALSIDTLGQQIFYFREGNELMICTVAPIPDSILRADTFQMNLLLDNFINDIVSGANVLIYSDVNYKGFPAKYYKVRVQDEYHQLYGLLLDSYTMPVSDTIYSFAYWRFQATELFDYSRQRMFYDMVEIQLPAVDSLGTDKEKEQEKQQQLPFSRPSLIVISLLSLGLVLLAYLLFKKKKQK